MDNIVLGILAHVDAGKTTLSESILYNTGIIKKIGRVDSKNSFLDNNDIERERGITIFSKQASFCTKNKHFDMLDTPGHVDFSAEMERTLQVIDYAVLVISGADEIFGHTLTLWDLLKQYKVPTVIFVNKMDRAVFQTADINKSLKKQLSESCVCINIEDLEGCYEDIALAASDETLLERYIESGFMSDADIISLIKNRKIFPVFYGSALKNEGVNSFLEGIDRFLTANSTDNIFKAKVFKITRDAKGERLTHVKIISGNISVKDELLPGEKINQIRLYNGEKYDTVNTIEAGRICAITGIESTYSGQGLGSEEDSALAVLEPVLMYELVSPEKKSIRQIYSDIKKLEEEMPELKIIWNEELEIIQVKIMGQVQIQILKSVIKERYGIDVDFKTGCIAYKETIKDSVIGVGHFEPLKHYAEVHLKLEPAPRGHGIIVEADCSEDILDKNWQRLIITHIKEKVHKGVLCGVPVTDLKITLINGRAHKKHTEGGDFRQATYRAIREGLMEAESILLEPYYNFNLSVPSEMLGRAMTDIDNMHGVIISHETKDNVSMITGYCPVYTMKEYQLNVNAYTHGKGMLSVSFKDYGECHNTEEIIKQYAYDPDADTYNPASSVFCACGSGYVVPWYEVKAKMHVSDEEISSDTDYSNRPVRNSEFDYSIGIDEIDSILNSTYNANSNAKKSYKKKNSIIMDYKPSKTVNNKVRPQLIIVDGYNVIFAWKELKELSKDNLDSAKDRLISVLSNYSSICGVEIKLVFDGYKVKNSPGNESIRENISVVHTKEDETADKYIERFTKEFAEKYRITVVSSDGLIQLITRGHDCFILSSSEFEKKINETIKEFREEYNL